jgi:Collagen triple helix repeat (20 copies).
MQNFSLIVVLLISEIVCQDLQFLKGEKGDRGIIGAKGEKGQKGDIGITGEKGGIGSTLFF